MKTLDAKSLQIGIRLTMAGKGRKLHKFRGSILASGDSVAAETASAFADSAAAATFIIIPMPLLNQYMNRINSLDNDQI
ncbi:MAG: hypothetical protein J6A14_05605 [Spirochaetaceae bacterium]|nr:hypothetical protein [Spirochaetaceae bacterium]